MIPRLPSLRKIGPLQALRQLVRTCVGKPVTTLAIAAALLLPITVAQAVSWSTAGGDQGRSGLQPLTAGSAPFEPMWSAQTPAGRGPATPVVITNGGPGPRAPRVAYGTSDGVIHLHSLYTGETVGPPGGIPISQSRTPWTFTGFDGL